MGASRGLGSQEAAGRAVLAAGASSASRGFGGGTLLGEWKPVAL